MVGTGHRALKTMEELRQRIIVALIAPGAPFEFLGLLDHADVDHGGPVIRHQAGEIGQSGDAAAGEGGWRGRRRGTAPRRPRGAHWTHPRRRWSPDGPLSPRRCTPAPPATRFSCFPLQYVLSQTRLRAPRGETLSWGRCFKFPAFWLSISQRFPTTCGQNCEISMGANALAAASLGILSSPRSSIYARFDRSSPFGGGRRRQAPPMAEPSRHQPLAERSGDHGPRTRRRVAHPVRGRAQSGCSDSADRFRQRSAGGHGPLSPDSNAARAAQHLLHHTRRTRQ